MEIFNVVVELEAITPVHFQDYPGITFRGGFGMAMKKAFCVMNHGRRICRECFVAETCAYARVFESTALARVSSMKKATNYPHPFVLTPLFHGPVSFSRSEKFKVSLTVIGNIVKYMPYMLHTLVLLGKGGVGKERGKFHISGIFNGNKGEFLGKDIDCVDFERLEPVDLGENPCGDRFELEFLTPCSLRTKGELLRTADFVEIVKNILRKREILNVLYCEGLDPLDRESLLEMASGVRKISENLQWRKYSRYSKRQGRRMPLSGFTGKAIFEGASEPLYELLKAAEYINVGRNSSFGFGSVRLGI